MKLPLSWTMEHYGKLQKPLWRLNSLTFRKSTSICRLPSVPVSCCSAIIKAAFLVTTACLGGMELYRLKPAEQRWRILLLMGLSSLVQLTTGKQTTGLQQRLCWAKCQPPRTNMRKKKKADDRRQCCKNRGKKGQFLWKRILFLREHMKLPHKEVRFQCPVLP